MKVSEFIKWSEKMQKEENRLMLVKGKEYTVSDIDKFKNFKSIGERVNLNAERIALIYLLKYLSILSSMSLNSFGSEGK